MANESLHSHDDKTDEKELVHTGKLGLVFDCTHKHHRFHDFTTGRDWGTGIGIGVCLTICGIFDHFLVLKTFTELTGNFQLILEGQKVFRN
jgi:hypothetical protein